LIWSDESGEGTLIAGVHGGMDRSGSFAFARKRWVAAGHRVLVYDRRGYNRSLAAGPPFSVPANVADLVDLLAGRPAIVVGHSLGGVIGLALAEAHPELVSGLVVYEAPMSWEPWWPRSTAGSLASDETVSPEDVAERFLRRMAGDRVWERLPATTRQQRRAEGPTLVAELRDVRRHVPYDPSRVEVPVVVGHGLDSAEHHRRGAHTLVERLPRATLVAIEGADHGAHRSHPEAFAALVGHLRGL
jgi:pimeloyl-ACP methyl ester carboxylesterase